MLDGVIAEELLIPSASTIPLWSDPDSFPSAIVSVPGFLLFEGQFNEGDLIYAAYVGDVAKSIFPPVYVDPDAVYNFTKGFSAAIVAPPLADADVVYRPTVLSKVLGPQLFVDVDVFGGARKITQGKATINQTVPISNVVDVDIVYGPIVERAGRTIVTQQMALATDSEVIHLDETTAATSVLLETLVSETASYTPPPFGYLSPASVSSADVVWSAGMVGPVAPAALVDGDVFYPPTQQLPVVPGTVPADDAFPVVSLARGFGAPIVIAADIINGLALGQPGSFALYVDAGEFISSPTIVLQSTYLTSASVVDSDTFYPPLEGQGIGVAYDPLLGADAVAAPVVNRAPLFPVVSVVDPEPIYVPVIGDAPHVPSLVVDVDAFLAPNIGVTQNLLAGILTDGDAFNTPALAAAAGFDGTLALDGPIMPATPQPTVIYIEG